MRRRQAKSEGPTPNCSIRNESRTLRSLMGWLMPKTTWCSSLSLTGLTLRGEIQVVMACGHTEITAQESRPHEEDWGGRVLALPGPPPRWTIAGACGLGHDQQLYILCQRAWRVPRT